MTLPNEHSASGLDILSKIRAVDQSGLSDERSQSNSSPRPNHNASAEQWQPLKTKVKPVFGGAVKATQEVEAMTIVSNEAATPTMSPSNRVLSTLEPRAPAPSLCLPDR